MRVNTLAVVGLGLIGGSVAMAARASSAAARIVGVDMAPRAREEAERRGIVNAATGELAAALADADLVVLAAPPRALMAMADDVARAVRPGALVTDVASVKRPIVSRYAMALRARARHVGGHPLAGSERAGLGAAQADLFRGATWFLTPTDGTDPEALAAVERWVRLLGGVPLALPPEVHDALLAATSHLPQAAASALTLAVTRSAAAVGGDAVPLHRLAGPGCRDATRLAASATGLWVDILLENADNILDAVARMAGELQVLHRLIADRDEEGLAAWLEAAGAARQGLVACEGVER